MPNKQSKIKIDNLIFFTLSIAVSMGAAISFIVFSKSIPVIICSFLFICSLSIAKYTKNYYLKYIMAGNSLFMLLLIGHLYEFGFDHLSSISFFIPLIYAYLLPDFFSSILVASILILQCLSVSKNIGIPELIGKSGGILFSSLSYASIFYLNRCLEKERNRYKKTSITDSLTGVSNLSYVMKIGEKSIADGLSLATYIMDIDHFKQFNDTHGHLIGNEVLIKVANILKKEVEGLDGLAGRLGGDEFIILIKGYTLKQAKNYFKQLTNRLKVEYFECDPAFDPVKISCSIGMAFTPKDSNITMQQLLNEADINMYFVKQSKNNLPLHNDLDMALTERQLLLVNSLAEKDMYSYVHTQYVVKHSINLAKALNLSKEQIDDIYVSAWLHDIGKVFIPKDILRKRSALADREYDIVKLHVENSIAIISNLNLPETINNSIRYHHERFDGTGYPHRILGKDTPIEARIMQIADAFSAMTVKSVYRQLLSTEDALKEIEKNSGSQFDPELAKKFIDLF